MYSNKALLLGKKLKRFEECITACDLGLKIDANFSKIYYHRGFAYESMGEVQKALNDYMACKTLDPSNSVAGKAVQRCLNLVGDEEIEEKVREEGKKQAEEEKAEIDQEKEEKNFRLKLQKIIIRGFEL